MTTLLERAFFGRAPLPRVDLPGPPARPLVGWRGDLIDFMRDPLAALYRVHACCGELGGLTEGNGAMVFAFGPEHNRALSTDVDRMVPFLALFPAPRGQRAVERIGDHILFNVRGERHSEERRVLGPPLHRRRLERWVAAIDAIAEQHVAALPRGAVIDAPAVPPDLHPRGHPPDRLRRRRRRPLTRRRGRRDARLPHPGPRRARRPVRRPLADRPARLPLPPRPSPPRAF
jgi:hypothetical protein